jgi:hypothetical protein
LLQILQILLNVSLQFWHKLAWQRLRQESWAYKEELYLPFTHWISSSEYFQFYWLCWEGHSKSTSQRHLYTHSHKSKQCSLHLHSECDDLCNCSKCLSLHLETIDTMVHLNYLRSTTHKLIIYECIT